MPSVEGVGEQGAVTLEVPRTAGGAQVGEEVGRWPREGDVRRVVCQHLTTAAERARGTFKRVRPFITATREQPALPRTLRSAPLTPIARPSRFSGGDRPSSFFHSPPPPTHTHAPAAHRLHNLPRTCTPLSAPRHGSAVRPLPTDPFMPTRRRCPPVLTSANVVTGVTGPCCPHLRRGSRPAGLCSSRTGGGESQPPVGQSPAHRQPPEAAPLRVATRRTMARGRVSGRCAHRAPCHT